VRVPLALRVAAGAACGLAALELGFRALEPRLGVDRERLARFREFVRSGGETAQFVAHPHVVYTRNPADPSVNALGFLDREFVREKNAGVPRIACLGSSTTEGGNAAQREGSYPYFLARILEQRRGRPVEALNFGMAGWTTAETLVNYLLVVQDFAPDVVLIHEAVNDVEPRAWPGFAADYSHYRKPWRDVSFSAPFRLLAAASDAFAALQMRRVEAFGLGAAVNRPAEGGYRFEGGRLPLETAAPFQRNILTIAEHVRLRGGHPVLITMPYDTARAREQPVFHAGLDEHNALLRKLAEAHGFLLVDLDDLARRRPEGVSGRFLDLVHMTPEGNRFKAEAIADALLAAKML
jgi:lysophospholipase L1-like esterase